MILGSFLNFFGVEGKGFFDFVVFGISMVWLDKCRDLINFVGVYIVIFLFVNIINLFNVRIEIGVD